MYFEDVERFGVILLHREVFFFNWHNYLLIIYGNCDKINRYEVI